VSRLFNYSIIYCYDLNFNSECSRKWQNSLCHRVHYATECTHVTIGATREKEYGINIVVSSGGCLTNDPRIKRSEKIMTGVLDIWFSNLEGAEMRGVLSAVQVDGAVTFVKLRQRSIPSAPQ
jgi:hypothetical protein